MVYRFGPALRTQLGYNGIRRAPLRPIVTTKEEQLEKVKDIHQQLYNYKKSVILKGCSHNQFKVYVLELNDISYDPNSTLILKPNRDMTNLNNIYSFDFKYEHELIRSQKRLQNIKRTMRMGNTYATQSSMDFFTELLAEDIEKEAKRHCERVKKLCLAPYFYRGKAVSESMFTLNLNLMKMIEETEKQYHKLAYSKDRNLNKTHHDYMAEIDYMLAKLSYIEENSTSFAERKINFKPNIFSKTKRKSTMFLDALKIVLLILIISILCK